MDCYPPRPDLEEGLGEGGAAQLMARKGGRVAESACCLPPGWAGVRAYLD